MADLVSLLAMLFAAPAGEVEVTDGPDCPAAAWVNDSGDFEDTFSQAVRLGFLEVRHEDERSLAVLTKLGSLHLRLARIEAA